MRFVDYAQISPTGATPQQYINGTAQDFSDFYDFQDGDNTNHNGAVRYGVSSVTDKRTHDTSYTIGNTDPGVFFYYTGLSNSIKGDPANGKVTVFIDQNDKNSDVGAFTTTNNDVKLFKVSDSNHDGIIEATQVQLRNSDITLGSDKDADTTTSLGDVVVKFTPDAVDSLYMISVKYNTNAVVTTSSLLEEDSSGNPILPTVNYTFTTDVGKDGTIEETAIGGITLAPKFAALMLDGDAVHDGHAPVLQTAELQSVVSQAITFWAQQGVDAVDLAALRGTHVQIADLGGTQLGLTDAANVVTIDDDAAGYGWFTGAGEVNLQYVDLLSTVVHEFGHVLGYDHDVMDATLAVGERDLPTVNMTAVNDWAATVVNNQVELVGVPSNELAYF
ncbi:hypothetical protein BCS42_03925 [Crenothrix sp. D3]|nr:hypothetical protein BCS42_03925 [Crenothrix sp. D3]